MRVDEICKEEWIQTYTGRRVNPLNLQLDDIDIIDIAHSLALINRFTGHTPEPYNVAQHSILVSRLCPPKYALWGLLHDAPEAYMNDISRPVKKLVAARVGPILKDIDSRIMDSVCIKFGLDICEPPEVKRADDNALANEAYSFFGHTENYNLWHHRFCNGYEPLGYKIKPIDWKVSETLFLQRFEHLIGGGE